MEIVTRYAEWTGGPHKPGDSVVLETEARDKSITLDWWEFRPKELTLPRMRCPVDNYNLYLERIRIVDTDARELLGKGGWLWIKAGAVEFENCTVEGDSGITAVSVCVDKSTVSRGCHNWSASRFSFTDTVFDGEGFAPHFNSRTEDELSRSWHGVGSVDTMELTFTRCEFRSVKHIWVVGYIKNLRMTFDDCTGTFPQLLTPKTEDTRIVVDGAPRAPDYEYNYC
jgi:hypothetical protein